MITVAVARFSPDSKCNTLCTSSFVDDAMWIAGLPARRSSEAVCCSQDDWDCDSSCDGQSSSSSSTRQVPLWMAERRSNSEWSDGVLTCGFDQRPPISTFSSYLIHLPTHHTHSFIHICGRGSTFHNPTQPDPPDAGSDPTQPLRWNSDLWQTDRRTHIHS